MSPNIIVTYKEQYTTEKKKQQKEMHAIYNTTVPTGVHLQRLVLFQYVAKAAFAK